MEQQFRVIRAALALGEFTIAELSGLSGVNEHTVRSVITRDRPDLFRKATQHSVPTDRGRGRPSTRWAVRDRAEVLTLLDTTEPPPVETRQYADPATTDWRAAVVDLAEDLLSKACVEAELDVRARLYFSAASSLRFAGSETESGEWWTEGEQDVRAVRARGIDVVARLGSETGDDLSVDTVVAASSVVVAAMNATLEHRKKAYFMPYAEALARAGAFPPMYMFHGSFGQKLVPLLDETWVTVDTPDELRADDLHVVTQEWAAPFAKVYKYLPIGIAALTFAATAAPMIVDLLKGSRRPAVVFGELDPNLVAQAGAVGVPFVPTTTLRTGDQGAIESVTAVVERFNAAS